VFSDEGAYLGVLTGSEGSIPFSFPYDVALEADGALYVVEYLAGRVTKVDLDEGTRAAVAGRYGRTGSGQGMFSTPWGIAAGGDGRVYVADTGNRRVVRLTP
jgi:DNA-binding beta-propeller fold protein YncE